MPKLDLAAIKARVEAAEPTSGKWKVSALRQLCGTDIPLLVARVEELQEALLGMVQQHCTGQWPTDNPEWFGSGCLSANANAIELLCEYGILEEVGESVGRAVEARAALSGEGPK